MYKNIYIAQYKIGDTITVKYLRNGKEKDAKLTLVANEDWLNKSVFYFIIQMFWSEVDENRFYIFRMF